MNRRETRTRNVALALLAPNLLGFLIFTAGPVLFSLIMAFTNWDLTRHNQFSAETIRFVGLTNFRNLFSGDEATYFTQYLGNTLYLMIAIPIGIALSLLGAIMLDKDLAPANRRQANQSRLTWTLALCAATVLGGWMCGAPPLAICLLALTGVIVLLGQLFGQTSFRTLYYLPNLTAGVAIFILWKALYRPETGPINMMLRPLLNGLTMAVTHTPAGLWHALGWLLYLAALALLLWSLFTIGRMFYYREIGVLSGLLNVIGVAAVALAIAGLGQASEQLPQFAGAAGGLQPPEWLSSLTWSKPALMLMGIFMAIGSNNMLMYLAALSNVPVELKEAAAIDGATPWQSFWHVTWPQLASTTFFIVIMSIIGGMQGGFDAAKVMTNGGPAGSTTTLAYYLYQRGFTDFQLGLASAIAWVMFLMIFVLTLINWKFGSSMVND